MKKIWKKNQILVSVLAIMIAVAGYLNFAGNKLANEDFMTMGDGVTTTDISDEDIYAVNVTDVDENMQGYATGETYDITDIDEDVATITDNYLDEPMATNIGEVADASDAAESGVDLSEETPGEAVFTSGNGVSSLAGAKLIKEQTRAKNKQTLMEIINNEGIAETEKQDAINTMIAMTDVAEKESAAEVARMLRFPAALQVEIFADGKMELVAVILPDDSEFVGFSIAEKHGKEVVYHYN